MRLLARLGAPILIAALVATSVACGSGGDKKSATSTPADASDSTAAPTKRAGTPTAKATSGTTSTKAAGSKTASATGTPKAASTVSATNGLDSYHYTVNIEFSVTGNANGINGKIEGDYVAPGSHAFTQTFEVAGIKGEESTVIIGGDAWQKQTSGDWKKTTADDPAVVSSTDLTSADPTFFADQSFVADIKVFQAKNDTVDGRAARRYDFDRDQFAQLGDAFGSDIISPADLAGITDFKMSVWVDEDTETLARAEITASGPAAELLKNSPITSNPGDTASISLKFTITRINDKSINIEPPI